MKKSFFTLIIPIILFACEPKENRQQMTLEAEVANVVMPKTIELGEEVAIRMTYKLLNDCGAYAGTGIYKSANSIYIRPMVQYTYTDSNPCLPNPIYKDEPVTYTPLAKGEYLFFFLRENKNEYIADTLVVL